MRCKLSGAPVDYTTVSSPVNMKQTCLNKDLSLGALDTNLTTFHSCVDQLPVVTLSGSHTCTLLNYRLRRSGFVESPTASGPK